MLKTRPVFSRSLLVVLGLSIAGSSLGALVRQSLTEEPQPDLWVEQSTIDLGEVPTGNRVRRSITVGNRGAGLLVLSKVGTSCRCTVGRLRAWRLRPGEATTLETVVTVSGQEGEDSSRVTIRSNDPDTPQQLVTLKFKARHLVKPCPPHASFGDLTGSKLPATTTITVTRGALADDSTLARLRCRSESPHVRAHLSYGEKAAVITAELADTTPLGSLRSAILLEVEGLEDYVLSIPVHARVCGPYRAEPESVILKVPPDSPRVEETVEIRGLGPADRVELEPLDAPYDRVVQLRLDASRAPPQLRVSCDGRNASSSFETRLRLRVYAGPGSSHTTLQVPVLFIKEG